MESLNRLHKGILLCMAIAIPVWILGQVLDVVGGPVFAILIGMVIALFLRKKVSKFFIVMAMGAIGLNTNLPKLVKSGGKPILLGFCCWVAITVVSLLMKSALCIR